MKPLFPPDNVIYLVCGKVDRTPLPTFPQALRRLLQLMSSQKGDIFTLEKRGHFYFGLTGVLKTTSNVVFFTKKKVTTQPGMGKNKKWCDWRAYALQAHHHFPEITPSVKPQPVRKTKACVRQ